MRDLNECTAEVFRRGEKRIKVRRRNRNRVFALCIPVCLIVAAWPIIYAMMPVLETSDLAQYAEEMVTNTGRNPACPYTAVEIQHYGTVTDAAVVAEMFHAVHSPFADADGNGRDAIENLPINEILPAEDDENRDLADEASQWKGYTIIFTDDDGWQAAYRLIGNTLVSVNTNETVLLNDFEVSSLMAVLGLSE